MEAGSPRIKRLLKTYKKSSGISMNGPNDIKAEVATVKPLNSSPDGDFSILDKNKKELMCALLTKRDSCSAELSETQLEDQVIACFDIGGEKRLCLAQIIRNILPNFFLNEITAVFTKFYIPSAVCSNAQLNMLKEKDIIPANVLHCGLVTKSDAQRFCSVLLGSRKHQKHVKFNDKVTTLEYKKSKLIRLTSFKVIHKCFGGCQGVFYQKLFHSALSECIECSECRYMFTPQKFVTHFHSTAEYKQTCHWGFDSANWKHYLKLDPRENPDYYDVLMNLFAYNGSDKEMLYEIQNKSYRADIKVVAPEDPQTQQYVSDYDGRQDDPPQLMHEQSTISPEIWHVPGEIPPNISLIPSERFNEFDAEYDENFISSGCDVPYKACHGSQQHDVIKTLTFHADENDFYNCAQTYIKSEVMDCEPAGTDHQQHININDNNGEDDDDESTNFEAVVRVMQQAHDEGYALFKTALNCGSKRKGRGGRGEGVGVTISNDDEDAAAAAVAAADDDEEQHRHELCESYMNVQKKYDNIIRDLLFKNNKLIEIAKSQRDGSLKSLSLQQYQQQRQRHLPEDNSVGMVELDGPSDNMSYQQTTNQTTNIINITNISKSFTNYNNICKPNLATISFDGSKNDNINKDNYSDNNNSCNDTISVYNKVNEYNRINGSKLGYSVVDPYIRAMTAPSRPVKSSKLSASSPSSFLSTSSSSHCTAVFKGGNHTTSNHTTSNHTTRNHISSNNNIGGYDNAPDDDDDDDHYEEMHVLKKRKRCHTFAGNSVRLVS